MLNVSLLGRHFAMNKKPPLFPNGTIAFVSAVVERRASWRADWPSIVKNKKKRKKGKKTESTRGKIHKNWQCCKMIGRVCSHGRRVPAATTLPGRIRFRARLSAADFWCGCVMGHSGWRTVTSTWTIDVSYQLQFTRAGYARDNCYWQIVMLVINHDCDTAPAAPAPSRLCVCACLQHKDDRSVQAQRRNYWQKLAFPLIIRKTREIRFILVINFNRYSSRFKERKK